MRHITFKNTIPSFNSTGVGFIVIAALLLGSGCGMNQPQYSSRGDPQAHHAPNVSQEVVEKCKAEAVLKGQANHHETTNSYGSLGRDSGVLFDAADGNGTDSGSRIGEAAGNVVGALVTMFGRDSFQEQAMRECLEAHA